MTNLVALYPNQKNNISVFFSITVRPVPVNPQRSTFDMLFSRPCTVRKYTETKCCNFWDVWGIFGIN